MYAVKKITTWLIDRGAIRAEEEELYIFAICNTFLTLVPMISVFIIAYFAGSFVEGLTLVIPFLIIRKFSGGFHFNSAVKCLITTICSLILLLFLTSRITLLLVFDVNIILSAVSISINSPIDSEARRLDDSEKIHFRNVSRFISLFFLILYLELRINYVMFGMKTSIRIAKSISSGMAFAALLQIPVLIKDNMRQQNT